MADLTGRTTIRVVLVDDDALVRAGLRLLLGGSDAIEIVDEAADGDEAVTAVVRSAADVALLDLRMPRRDGIAALPLLRAARPDLGVLVLTTFDADDLVLGALRAGAQGFLLKDAAPDVLLDAIRRVADGQVVLAPAVTRRLVDLALQAPGEDRASAARRRLAVLTPRERVIAEAIAGGLSNGDIAAREHVSLSTVKSHTARILQKLGADNRTQIAIRVHEAR